MKYKLIKEYPGSPKLGNIIDNLENDWIENYPEFWREVVEKDYEILSLIEGKFIYPCDKYGEDFINQLFNTLGVSIHSVKRLSDGEIFTIGDITNYDIIKKIKVNHDSFCIITKDYNIWNKSKTIVNFCKQPIFKTEDGVDIFEDDEVYYVENYNLNWCIIPSYYSVINSRKYFSTKEKAEKYILINKPCLSLKETLDILDLPLYKNHTSLKFKDELKKLVKSKIQQSV